MKGSPWYQKESGDILSELRTDLKNGLKNKDVKRLQKEYSNRIEEGPKNSAIKIFLQQFTDTMVLVLLGATVLSGIIGDMADAITIMAIVVLNAIMGFVQEYRAEQSLEAIKKMSSPFARTLREGKRVKIPAEQLVPGDIVILESGDRVPADLRLLETVSLEIDEASLTGESVPAEKNAVAVYRKEIPLADRANMAFMGTVVSRGRAVAVVVEVGMQTIMGSIATMIKESDTTLTPLQLKLAQLGKILIVICIAVCATVALLGILRGENIITMLMAGISLAVAAIPEGLPAIVTVVLALGVQRMARSNAIIRKLSAVETLGCTTVICADKTGTLTQNKMTVKKIANLDRVIDVEGDGYNPAGRFMCGQANFNPLKDKALMLLMEAAGNCNNAILEKISGRYELQGDPTEGALLALAMKAGAKRYVRTKELPFDSSRKRMSVVVDREGEQVLLVKGALDILVALSSKVFKNGEEKRLEKEDKQRLLELQDQWAGDALRVLGFAVKKLKPGEADRLNSEQLEKGLILLGICGMMDPPRPGVEVSVKQCIEAGIIPIMITGDHPVTAQAIAREIGISSSVAVTGNDIDKYSDEKLYEKAVQQRLFARVSPQHKFRIVKALQKKYHVVAMTGDGVNDAPAVKSADIGISMGKTGTDVTKEASSMILADDDFSTIVKAVYEGRAIYDNIRKFIRYLLGCNIGEILVMFIASLTGMPLPMLPIQILWVNLVTDGLPAMALGLEPPEPGIMQKKPRARGESIFSHGLGWIIWGRGAYIAIITLLMFITGIIYTGVNGIEQFTVARTMAFTTLVFAQLFYVFECRSEKFSIFELGITGNRFLLAAVAFSVGMQLSVIYVPFFQSVFHTCPLALWQWALILAVSGFKLIYKYCQYILKRLFIPNTVYGTINS